jgi:hypothetical protein
MIAQGSHECSEPLRFQLGRSFRYHTMKAALEDIIVLVPSATEFNREDAKIVEEEGEFRKSQPHL